MDATYDLVQQSCVLGPQALSALLLQLPTQVIDVHCDEICRMLVSLRLRGGK
jgi:hypothetical protein